MQARNEGTTNQPLIFRTEYKTGLKFTDSEKNSFDVDESFLSVFRDVYTDKSCKMLFIQINMSDSIIGNFKSSSMARNVLKLISFANPSHSWPPKQPRGKLLDATLKLQLFQIQQMSKIFPLRSSGI